MFGKVAVLFLVSVAFIPDDGVAKIGELCAYLMHTACEYLNIHQGSTFVVPQGGEDAC